MKTDAENTIGLIVNPLAGLGGSKALKGTDGDLAQRAISMGAGRIAVRRTVTALSSLIDALSDNHVSPPRILTCHGLMGESALLLSRYPDYTAVYAFEGRISTGEDTTLAAAAMEAMGASLIAFAGGDGTLRDVSGGIRRMTPLMGIPSGVKMYSGVFIRKPELFGPSVLNWFDSGCPARSINILDFENIQGGNITVSSYGTAVTPMLETIQQSKEETAGEEESKMDIAEYFISTMDDSITYLMGTGSTVKEIVRDLGYRTHVLGVDVFRGRRLIYADATDSIIAEAIENVSPDKVRVVVTPAGGSGFLFGRGNQQFTPEILKKIGRKGIIVVCTPRKLESLGAIRIDTGDRELDSALSGNYEVIKGYGIRKIAHIGSE
jgi:predicted polyphosphate/ATP-dependent NAD kinase